MQRISRTLCLTTLFFAAGAALFFTKAAVIPYKVAYPVLLLSLSLFYLRLKPLIPVGAALLLSAVGDAAGAGGMFIPQMLFFALAHGAYMCYFLPQAQLAPRPFVWPVLTALLEAECFDQVTVMVQKEVAQRIIAAPGTADYSAFSIFCQYYAQPEILFDVGPNCFLPAPKVTSAVIALKIRKERPWNIESPELFFRTVRASFAMRRKKLQNGLASGFPQLGKAGAAQVIASCGLPENVRGETLGIEAFAALSNAIGKALQEG